MRGHILILFHLRRDQRLITAKSYLFTIGQKFNLSSINNLEFALTLNADGPNSLDSWASDAGLAPAVQIQENEVMSVASLCYTVEPALEGSGHISQDDARELQLFELEQKIQRQAQTLANKHRSSFSSSFREEWWVMSKDDLARFKSANAKLLALQRRKALLDEMAVELDDDQAMQPTGIMERAERDFYGQILDVSSGQLAQLL